MSGEPQRPYGLAARLATEFLGLTLFVYVGSLSGPAAVQAAFAHGLCIFVLVASLGHVRWEGGQFECLSYE